MLGRAGWRLLVGVARTLAWATNQRARLPGALGQVGTLDERDLRMIAKSKNVPAAISAQARRLLLTVKVPK